MTDIDPTKASLTDRARDAATHAVEATKETTTHAVEVTKDAATKAANKTADQIESNPLAALLGGVAIGIAIGALLPRTQRERETLGPLGKRLTESAGAVVRAARDAGRQEIEALIPDKHNAKEKASALLGNVASAARDAVKSAA
ncbi:hypothetical protein [Sphingomonas yantingensis]|uniref:ElaB/YqjD/DUF883 family membrane-anchored ribosome-binding protein n=1 Tax=Sphingomonas yantingensis TaxID=1241761 RepID=A0A7W9AS99_9SPHN|nr:hypothetical protein [Sphingomonas yantingensis]MBB5699669.1 ElaB/YqjD/DUF883 family membrane-anchored ribosome-binding protein [Sphingomonas yantingensis]